LEHLAEKLRTSLKARMGELVGLGDKGNHGDRWTHQAQLLRAIEKILSGK